MFKEIVNDKVNFNFDKIGNSSEPISFAELTNHQDIDDFISNFLKAELDWWIYEDEIFRDVNHSFKLKLNSEQSNKINDIYSNSAQIITNELKILFNKAVALHLNYLILPQKTLSYFVFSNEPKLSRREINLKLGYFTGYEYLISELKELVNNKDVTTRIEFENKIKLIEKNNLSSINQQGFEELLNPIYNFISDDRTKVSSAIIKAFLEDKGLLELSNLIEKQISSGISELSKEEMFNLLGGNTNFSSNEGSQHEEKTVQEEEASDVRVSGEDVTEDIKSTLNELLYFLDSDKVSEEILDENVAADTAPTAETIEEKEEIEEKEKKDIDSIMASEDGAELSSDDIDALFNQ